jgi:hypothetical protein
MFGDESGTMPLADHDRPFVVAAVAGFSLVSTVAPGTHSPRWLVNEIVRNDLIPFIAYIRPRPGYAHAVTGKLVKMDVMARMRRLVTGRHEFLPVNGLPFRNMLWTHCSIQAMAQAVTSAVFSAPVTRIEVVLDRKTLAPETRSMLVSQCREMPVQLAASIARVRPRNPAKADGYLANLQLTPDQVTVQWSDDPGVNGSSPGLRLAHCLARLYLAQLLRARFPSLPEMLADAKFPECARDITAIVTRSLTPDAISTWERVTGLREPQT